MTTISLLCSRIHKYGREADFLANVVHLQYSRPTTKLKGLVALLDRGHDVRFAQFSLDVLLVDGYSQPWTVLEQAATASGLASLMLNGPDGLRPESIQREVA